MRATGPSSCKDDEGWSNGAQGGGSGHLQEYEGPGVPGGGSAANRMPKVDGEALVAKNGRPGGRAARQEG